MTDELKPGDQVQILVNIIPGHGGLIATVNNVRDDQITLYFGDQDEDEWVYKRHELAAVPSNRKANQ